MLIVVYNRIECKVILSKIMELKYTAGELGRQEVYTETETE